MGKSILDITQRAEFTPDLFSYLYYKFTKSLWNSGYFIMNAIQIIWAQS